MASNSILIIQFSIDFGLMVLIWMVQRLVYPGFEFLNSDTFHKWHRRYAQNMTFIVAPMMFVQVGFSVYQIYTELSLYAITYAALVMATWVTTFVIFVPIHKKLDNFSHDISLCRRLTNLNWIRVILWTAIVVLDLFYRFL